MAVKPEGSPQEPAKAELAQSSQPRPKQRKTKGKAAAKASDEPVLSGRLLLVAALFIAMVFIPLSPLSQWISRKSPTATRPTAWAVGSEGVVHLTVVTADYNKLACAGSEMAGPHHCAFDGNKKPWPRPEDAPIDDNKKHVIQPYRTPDGTLILVAGLWAQPVVATRLHNEPPQAIAEKKLARFVVECRMKFLAEWQDPWVRWSVGQAWSQQGNEFEPGKPKTAVVAEPQECRILERKRTS